jgi:phospholipase/carboxylesterase
MSQTTQYGAPVAIATGSDDPSAPLVVLLHGRGTDERTIIGLADHLPTGPAYVALRAPIAEGGGYAWFANRGLGRPIAESLDATIRWFRGWLDDVAGPDRQVLLIGFSGGAAAAGGLLLADPDRFAGTAILYGTVPFDAGLDTGPGRLAGAPVFVAQGENDTVMPPELMDRTWAYLHGDSGAAVTGHRDATGHQLSMGAVTALNAWVTQRT